LAVKTERFIGVLARRLVIVSLSLLSTGLWSQEGYRFQVESCGSGVLALTLMGQNEIEESFGKDLYSNPLNYLLLLPGLFSLVLLLGMRGRGKRRDNTLAAVILTLVFLPAISDPSALLLSQRGIEAFKSGNHEEALEWFARAEKLGGENAALRYNIALCHFVLGSEGHALFCLRESIRLDPRNPTPRRVLKELEQRLSLTSQVPPGRTLHPNLPFVLMLLLANLSFLSLGFLLWLKRGSLFILSVLFIIALLGATGVFLFALSERNRPVAVVAIERGGVKRIPVDEAREWMNLKVGTSLLVKGHAQGYYLVRTGLGLEGWIDNESVLFNDRWEK
jgi:tetratricopeptide (TPR) repeat protein